MPSDRCPKCDSVAMRSDSDGLITYECGTLYVDGRCDSQSTRCFCDSSIVRRRASTITGILNACDQLERDAVMDLVALQFRCAGHPLKIKEPGI